MTSTAIGAVILAAVLTTSGWLIKLLIDIRSSLSLIQYQVKELRDRVEEIEQRALHIETLRIKPAPRSPTSP